MPSQAPFTSLTGRGDRKSAWASGKDEKEMSGLIVSHSLSFLLRNLSLENDLSRAMEPLYDNETRTRGHTLSGGWALVCHQTWVPCTGISTQLVYLLLGNGAQGA